MSKQNKIPKVNFPEMSPAFNQHYSQMVDTMNSAIGWNGPIVFNDHVDMQGNQVKNAGNPTDSGDLVSQSFANDAFGAAALAPEFEAGGSNTLQSFRRVADQNQQEPYSSFLKSTMSTPPNANTAEVSFQNLATTVVITVKDRIMPAPKLTFADRSNTWFAGRTDTVQYPANVTIVSVSSTGNTVTVTVTAAETLAPGNIIVISGVTTLSGTANYNGTVTIVTIVNPVSFTYTLTGAGTGTGVGGSIETTAVYYYYLSGGRHTLSVLSLSSAADTPSERLSVNTDGNQLIAVATVTTAGGSVSQSAAGNTPNNTVNGGSFF